MELSYVPFLSPLGRAENREKYPMRQPELRGPAWSPQKTQTPVRKSRVIHKPRVTNGESHTSLELPLWHSQPGKQRGKKMRVQIVHKGGVTL